MKPADTLTPEQRLKDIAELLWEGYDRLEAQKASQKANKTDSSSGAALHKTLQTTRA